MDDEEEGLEALHNQLKKSKNRSLAEKQKQNNSTYKINQAVDKEGNSFFNNFPRIFHIFKIIQISKKFPSF